MTATATQPRAQAHVLLVDDDHDLLRLLTMRLHPGNDRVSAVASASRTGPPGARIAGSGGLRSGDERAAALVAGAAGDRVLQIVACVTGVRKIKNELKVKSSS